MRLVKNIYLSLVWDWGVFRDRKLLRGYGKRTGVFYEFFRLWD